MSLVINAATDRIQRTANGPDMRTFTLAMWAKRLTTNAGTERVWMFLDGSGDLPFVTLQTDTANAFMVRAHDGTNTADYQFTNAPATGNWVYLAVVGGDTTATAYHFKANGVLVESGTTTGTAINLTDTAVNMSVMTMHFDEYVDGLVAHARLWNARLTQAQLEREMRSPWPVLLTNLNTAFTGRDTTITDVSGNGRNWSATSITVSEEQPPLPYRNTRQRPYRAGGAVAPPSNNIPGRRIYAL